MTTDQAETIIAVSFLLAHHSSSLQQQEALELQEEREKERENRVLLARSLL
jgi:hypothetical protein